MKLNFDKQFVMQGEIHCQAKNSKEADFIIRMLVPELFYSIEIASKKFCPHDFELPVKRRSGADKSSWLKFSGYNDEISFIEFLNKWPEEVQKSLESQPDSYMLKYFTENEYQLTFKVFEAVKDELIHGVEFKFVHDKGQLIAEIECEVFKETHYDYSEELLIDLFNFNQNQKIEKDEKQIKGRGR